MLITCRWICGIQEELNKLHFATDLVQNYIAFYRFRSITMLTYANLF